MSLNAPIRVREDEAANRRPEAHELEGLLNQILESPPFRTSKQCKGLLRYIVEHSVNGDDTALRERVIGAEVFGREPAYDTNEDPVVRMRASDVRKRLAQFYQSLEPETAAWHIELQPGSYRAHFRHEARFLVSPHVDSSPEPSPQASASSRQAEQTPRRHGWLLRKTFWICASVGLLGFFLALVLRVHPFGRSPQERFWAPLTAAKQPVLIYLGANVTYVFRSEFLAKYRAAHQLANTGPEIVLDLPPNSSIKADDLIPMEDTFVTTDDTSAIVELTTQLRDLNKPFMLRFGRDLSMGDLRNRPSIMVGAFNNRWTMALTQDLPFSFREGVRIQDRDHPARSWSVPADAHESTTDDYALVTRVLSSKTGGPAILVAGIGSYGTQAAAEFLTSSERMRQLLSSAPPGWENRNMQAVLHVKVIGFQPVAEEIVATSYW